MIGLLSHKRKNPDFQLPVPQQDDLRAETMKPCHRCSEAVVLQFGGLQIFLVRGSGCRFCGLRTSVRIDAHTSCLRRRRRHTPPFAPADVHPPLQSSKPQTGRPSSAPQLCSRPNLRPDVHAPVHSSAVVVTLDRTSVLLFFYKEGPRRHRATTNPSRIHQNPRIPQEKEPIRFQEKKTARK